MVNLEKSAESFKVSLAKKGIIKMPELEVVAAIDVSGSFLGEHRAGLTGNFMTRIVPWGMTFDPDKKLDVFTFSDGPRHAYYVGAIEQSNYENFVEAEIVDNVPGWGGGTDYSYVLRMILGHFGWVAAQAPCSPNRKPGFLARIFGGVKNQDSASTEAPRRAIVFFVTDGQSDDPNETRKVIGDAERAGYETFFVMVGMSKQQRDFPLLRSLANSHGNVIFRKIDNIRDFNKMSDDDLNEFFLDDKLTAWLSR
jgi:hypothetical protein